MSKMLRAICFAVCLCLTTVLASAAPFVSAHGYTVTPPPGWVVSSEAEDDAYFVFPAGALDGLTPSVIIRVGVSPPGMTIASLTAELVAGFKKGPPNTVILSQKSSSLGGMPDLDTVFQATKQGRRFHCRMVYVLKNKLTYIIIAASPEKTHAKYDAAVVQMLASVRWKT